MDFATRDLVMAILHHILVFAIFGVVAFELATIQQGMSSDGVRRAARVDIWYGILAAAILVVGFLRAVFAAKGWAYYASNTIFWAKIATFLAVGLLSIIPTLSLISWRRMLKKDELALPAEGAIRSVQRFLWAEILLFGVILAFAAAMARGYGAFGLGA